MGILLFGLPHTYAHTHALYLQTATACFSNVLELGKKGGLLFREAGAGEASIR